MPDFVDIDRVRPCEVCGLRYADNGEWCRCSRCAHDHWTCKECRKKVVFVDRSVSSMRICPRYATREQKVAAILGDVYPMGPEDSGEEG